MANGRQETHVWFDGESWMVYSERRADIARFTKWLGTPTRYSRSETVAAWDGVDRDALRIRRKAKRGSRAVSPATLEALSRGRKSVSQQGLDVRA